MHRATSGHRASPAARTSGFEGKDLMHITPWFALGIVFLGFAAVLAASGVPGQRNPFLTTPYG